MPFKMIAKRAVYRPDEGKEYQKGQSFTVESEKDRDRLLRTKRASLDDSGHAVAKSMKQPIQEPIVQKVEAAVDPDPVVSSSDEVAVVDPLRRPSRYRRADMRSED